MKKVWLLVMMGMFLFSSLQAQFLFDDYETHPDSVYITNYLIGDNADSTLSGVTNSLETTTVFDGTSALRMDWAAQRSESWGGFAKFEFWNPDSNAVYDLSKFKYISLRYYVETPSSDPGHVHLRIQLYDYSDAASLDAYDANAGELWYSFHYILDDDPGWHELRFPLEDVGDAAFAGSNGFHNPHWAGISGNEHLDLDQIKGFGYEFSIDGTNSMDIQSGTIIVDNLSFDYDENFSLVLFNGKLVDSRVKEAWAWSSGAGVEEGTGHVAKTNSYRWDQGAGQAWCGFGFTFDPTYMNHVWMKDSLKFWIKAPSGTGTLRVSFEDSNVTKIYTELQEPTGGYNDTWQQVKIPLKDINIYDQGANFDTSAVKVLHIYAPGNGGGHTILFDDIWTGNPPIDVVPPPDPLPPIVITGTNTNQLTWLDVSGETGETYYLYYSKTPFTSDTDPGVEVVEGGLAVPEQTGNLNHLLYSPLGDSTLSFYYGIKCVDAAGNESNVAVTTDPVVNTAKGIATISLTPPATFTADGDLSEWSSITPFRVFPSEGAHIATNTTIDGDGDLSVLAYFAMDTDSLYFAFDVVDDVLDTTSNSSWLKDSPDLFIGLYNWHGAPHNGYGTDPEPDYHFRFLPTKVILDNLGGAVVSSKASGHYAWTTKFPVGYIVEGTMALSDLASLSNTTQFVPVEGMRIPLDMAFNDADDGAGNREGILTWSPYNDDTSWQSPKFWMYSWTGSRMSTVLGIADDNVEKLSFALNQNYPNPFNPATTIEYSVSHVSDVHLAVYNMLGQKVMTLVNKKQGAGHYTIQFNANNLPSGVYFYRLEAGNFTSVKKMILMK